jgi:hypothetical protein
LEVPVAFQPGFDPAEAATLISLCAIVNDNTTYSSTPSPAPAVPPGPNYPNWPGIPNNEVPIPSGWAVKWTPPGASGLDNFWQFWENTNQPGQYAVVFQGTEDADASVAEDVMMMMIPAQGTITINGTSTSYTFAQEAGACIHAGYAYGLATMMKDVATQLEWALAFHQSDIEVYITGHSMGGALATLCRSFLAYYDYGNLPSLAQSPYKTYVFAQAKPGNDAYGNDFEMLNADNMAIRVVNSEDWVPQCALTLEQLSDLKTPNPISTYGAQYPVLEKFLGFIASGEADLIDLLQEALVAAIKAKSGDDVTFTVAPTLNYTSCGTQNVVLKGTAAAGAAELADMMWQHHATMYYALLTSQYPPS